MNRIPRIKARYGCDQTSLQLCVKENYLKITSIKCWLFCLVLSVINTPFQGMSISSLIHNTGTAYHSVACLKHMCGVDSRDLWRKYLSNIYASHDCMLYMRICHFHIAAVYITLPLILLYKSKGVLVRVTGWEWTGGGGVVIVSWNNVAFMSV